VSRTARGFTIAGIVAFLLIVLVPFWWIASMSFKTYEQIQFATSIYVPKPFTWDNYTVLWTATRFPLWLRNSLVTAVLVTLVTTIVASLAGYAVARLRFPGREWFASLILVLYLVPPALLFIPLFAVMSTLRLIDTHQGLILAYLSFSVPFSTWLLMGYFRSVPLELEEAALVDGCSRLGSLVRIILPMSLPALAVVTFFSFTQSWNEFLYANVFVNSVEVRTITTGLSLFVVEDVFFWGPMMGASVLSTLPPLVMYLIFQRWVVKGLTLGAVKG